MQKRHWCFTLNNYDESDLRRVDEVVSSGLGIYLCYQPERGELGTRHLQGFVSFKNARQLGGVKRVIGDRAHLEPMRGTIEQAVAYCCKEESRDADAGFGFKEFGCRPAGAGHPGHRTDLSEAITAIREGKRGREFFESHGDVWLRYGRGMESAFRLYEPKRTEKTIIYWFYGRTGTGKSMRAQEMAPDAYWKNNSSWWDGYDGQEDVIIDDYRCDFCKFSELLRLFDRYPLQLQVKGGTVQFRSKRIFVTAPYHPSVMWSTRTEEDLGQLLRRIENIEEFGHDPTIIFN